MRTYNYLTTKSQIKNTKKITLNGTKSRLNSAEEKISKLAAVVTETIQNKAHKGKKDWKTTRTLVTCGIRLSGLTDL